MEQITWISNNTGWCIDTDCLKKEHQDLLNFTWLSGRISVTPEVKCMKKEKSKLYELFVEFYVNSDQLSELKFDNEQKTIHNGDNYYFNNVIAEQIATGANNTNITKKIRPKSDKKSKNIKKKLIVIIGTLASLLAIVVALFGDNLLGRVLENVYSKVNLSNEGSRIFYSFYTVDPRADYIAEAFSPQSLDVSKEVLRIKGINNPEFMRGWKYDINRNGKEETILLFRGILDEKMERFYGNSHFVFASENGEAQYLCSGFERDLTHLTMRLLRYPTFDHIMIHTGNDTLAGMSTTLIYSLNDGLLKEELILAWTNIPLFKKEYTVFIEESGPQGMPPRYYFWDTKENTYSNVGFMEIESEIFLKEFDYSKASFKPEELEDIKEHSIPPQDYTVSNIKKVEICGNKYYYLTFDTYYDSRIVWKHNLDGGWEVKEFPFGTLRDSLYVETDKFDIDMYEAERRAIKYP